MEKLVWLFPDFFGFESLSFESQLSTVFVAVLLFITVGFLLKSLRSYVRAYKRVNWLKKSLKDISSDNVALKRVDLLSSAKEKNKTDNVGHLWQEFDETLIEIRKGGETQLFNTFDAEHFFNSSTLAKGVTDNRMIAAVPGFLTAIGVIGTFVGLQLGLSEVNISSNVTIDEMKSGVSAVIGGAKVAFMTSIWGVFLSVLFNFLEKLLEQSIRIRINDLQIGIDEIFPRLSPESQLQDIADNSYESRESLQGLAEQIGIKMQESMLTATRGISEALEKTLTEIMAPAINKLVDETSEGNQKALEDLLTKFMEGFGEQGKQQRVAMDSASEKVNESISDMTVTMQAFINKLETSQNASGEREKDLIANISNQVAQMMEQSNTQTHMMGEMLQKQANVMSDQFEKRELASSQREQDLASNIQVQIEALTAGISQQSHVLSEFVQNQLESLGKSFNEREINSSEREKELTGNIHNQIQKMTEGMTEQSVAQTNFMSEQITSLSRSFEVREVNSDEREKQLITSIQNQVKSLMESVSAQGSVLTTFVNEQMTDLTNKFEDRDIKMAQRSKAQSDAIQKQSNTISASTQQLVQQIESSIQKHQSSSEHILQQGKSLQQSVESSINASVSASSSMRESASELKSAAENMNVFGSHIKEAGNKLSGAVTEAVETTKDLASQNMLTAERISDLRIQLLDETAKFKDIADQIDNMIVNAGSTFESLKSSQSDYLTELKRNVSELATQMTDLLSDYATRANSQTANHLQVWAESTTSYATTMNTAAKTLASVVDDIQDKVGA
ncbi:hypothetical protein A9Q98_14675 [Thalassotalea sp. 42_200_T64]|nr:hypothetical protein A9Q98_14675 [Thalassotalea sp. 42_200_T64]